MSLKRTLFYFAFCLLILYVTVCVIHYHLPPERTSIVQLRSGQVRGIVQNVAWINRKLVNFYQGIRYGNASCFEMSKPVDRWKGIYEADSYRDACPQFASIEDFQLPFVSITSTESEDCLYLNVWQPISENNRSKSVMVWIHGGAFEIGTIFTTIFDGKYIAQQGDVIVVSVSYRLGPLGFLYAGEKIGNFGLHDQILALKWVQENILHFGGDPNRVTIFGESAGSMSVGSLILSPLTKGLFKRAIMQSGAPIAPLFIQSKSELLKRTKNFAKKLDCPTEKMSKTINCLKHNRTVSQMQKVWFAGFMRNKVFSLLYGDSVLPVNPVETLRKGKLPNRDIDLLYGVTRDEGAEFVLKIWSKVEPVEKFTIESAKHEMIKIIKHHGYSQEYSVDVANFYGKTLNNNSTQDDFKSTIGRVWGDFHLTCPTVLFAEEYAKFASPTNRYFSYRLMQPIVVLGYFRSPPWMGVTHAQDLFYLFMQQFVWFSSSSHYQLSIDMIQAWTHFAKYGYPGKLGGVNWEEAFEKNKKFTKYIHLEGGNYVMVGNHFVETCNTFWKNKIFI